MTTPAEIRSTSRRKSYGEVVATARRDPRILFMVVVGEARDFGEVVAEMANPGLGYARLTELIDTGIISHHDSSRYPDLPDDLDVRALFFVPSCFVQVLPRLQLVGE